MFIITEQPDFLNMVIGLGFIGWITKGAKALMGRGKKPDQESAREGISKATEAIQHNRKYAEHGRQQAGRLAKSQADRAPRRRIERQIARNQESRSARRRSAR